MNTDEQEPEASASAGANTSAAGPPAAGNRAAVLGILVAVVAVVEFGKDIIFVAASGEQRPAWFLIYYLTLACLPFLLARVAPEAAGFDRQWLPGSRWDWLRFLGLLFLALAAKVLVAAMAAAIVGHPSTRPFTGAVTPMGIILWGISIILVGPVAEEIFFRGYLLEQLRKLARSSRSLLIQSLLFALWHLYTWGLYSSIAVFNSFFTFLLGMILGGWRIKLRSLVPLVLAHILLNATVIPSLKGQYDRAVLKSVRSNATRPTISRQTTYITEPLRRDGYPDYVAALNQRWSKGITPENNSAVLFWKAVGPADIQEQYRARYFQMLGIPPLPATGDYFVDLQQHLARQKGDAKRGNARAESVANDNAYALLDAAEKRPWTKHEFPVLAAWLAANEKPLTLLTEAAKRARRYDPLVGGERTPLIAILQPAITPYHGPGLVGALTARAMLRLSNAQFDGAWEDLLTCHRLARLVGQGPMLVDYLIGRTVDGRACLGEQAFSGHTCLTAARLRKMREDLDRLPPMPPLAERIDVGERLDFLNIVSDFSRHDRASLLQIASGADLELLGAEKLRRAAEAIANYSADTRVDWGIPLRVGNSWFDRIADAYRKPTGIRRQQALDKIAADFQKLRAMAGDVASLDQAMGVDPTRSLSERLGQVVLIMFWPSTAVEFDLEAAPAMTFELTRLAFALAEYRADHGAYPVKLAELAPRYVRQVPKDIFNDAELRYRRENKGYRLYSVGRNGRDDGGRGVENGRRAEGAEKNDWDDLVIRMPGTDKQ